MKKDIIQTVKILLTAIVLSLGISYVYAWTAPTLAPPDGNVPAPLNTGLIDQTKGAGLGLTNLVANSITLGGITETTWPSVPSGAVMSFDLASCPSGWSEYTSARNRVIIGSGSSYSRGSTGGASTVTLTIAQMPRHNHSILAKYNDPDIGNPGRVKLVRPGVTGTQTTHPTEFAGNNQSHNNMQPFIALLYCIKS